jgi:hypothetical protein
MRALVPLLIPLLAAGAKPATQCSAPVAVPVSVKTPNATFYNDGEPPVRFAHVPDRPVQVSFGQEAIDQLCGRPPCGMRFEGCTSNNKIALPDPYKTDAKTFARIVRHELGHHAGWPETHGA